MAQQNSLVSIANIASTTDYVSPKVMRFILQSAARELLPNERVAKCLRAINPTAQRVEIHKSKDTGAAHYRNLLVCSRVWHCPVCAAKISETRRMELSKATKSWKGGIALVTFTLSHSNRVPLKGVLDSVLTAHRDFKAGRWFQEMCEYFGWSGSVKTLEITHGLNGWHPHIHELIFTTNVLDEDTTKLFENQVSGHWRYCLKKISEYASVGRGVTLKMGDEGAGEYISKFGETRVRKDWTFAHELTKQTVKKGKFNGRTPTQLLYDYVMGDDKAGKLWQEYAIVLKGRHQLVWSRGTRDLIGLGKEPTDDEIAEKIPENTYLLASITRGQWQDVLANDAVGTIINAAETKTAEEFKAWLSTTLAFWADV